jgi:hypothetical protein
VGQNRRRAECNLGAFALRGCDHRSLRGFLFRGIDGVEALLQGLHQIDDSRWGFDRCRDDVFAGDLRVDDPLQAVPVFVFVVRQIDRRGQDARTPSHARPPSSARAAPRHRDTGRFGHLDRRVLTPFSGLAGVGGAASWVSRVFAALERGHRRYFSLAFHGFLSSMRSEQTHPARGSQRQSSTTRLWKGASLPHHRSESGTAVARCSFCRARWRCR